jgi:hypothetical protein
MSAAIRGGVVDELRSVATLCLIEKFDLIIVAACIYLARPLWVVVQFSIVIPFMPTPVLE